jgi:apoptosis-inducing factor 3
MEELSRRHTINNPYAVRRSEVFMDEIPPNLVEGIALARIPDGGMVSGKVGDEDVLLARCGDDVFAVGAKCSHYGANLAKGLLVDDQIRCPWHHACFSLRTGKVLRRPALEPLVCWEVERRDDNVFVRQKQPLPRQNNVRSKQASDQTPGMVVIVGGGAAGLSAADTLRREGYDGALTMISADVSPPYDRPNLSKDYLAGDASDDWIALRPESYYREHRIELLLDTRVTAIDVAQCSLQLDDGAAKKYDRLLIATGAEPIQLAIPGAHSSQVHYLRTYADSRALIQKAAAARNVLVLGSSFIGLEVAAALRARGLTVDVVAQERQPLAKLFGPEVSTLVQNLHESKGVTFHLDDTIAHVEERTVTLKSGIRLEADLIVLGVGVRPDTRLAEQAGLTVDDGVVVDEYLETSQQGVFAAGDIARWPDAHSGERIRVEHWVVAGRQGQTAARNMMGARERFDAIPFFWTHQFDLTLDYIGHADKWDRLHIEGSLDAKDCTLSYYQGDRVAAVLTIGRDLQSLRSEAALERD